MIRIPLPLAAALLFAGCSSVVTASYEVEITDVGKRPQAEDPDYAGVAKKLVAAIPDGATVAVAYLDLKHLERKLGRGVSRDIRETYPDRFDIHLANAARALKRRVTVVDRRNMTHYLAAQKLQASDMLPLDPRSRVKLQRVKAVNTYVYWKVVREGANEEWILRAVGVESGQLHGGLVHRYRRPPALAGSRLVISRMAPSSGWWGTSVTVTGTGFGDRVQVILNGAPAEIQSASRGPDGMVTVVFTVPRGATSGDVTVSSGGKSARAGGFNVQ